MKLYGLKNCDTCKKAMKALEAADKSFTFVDIREAEISEKQISGWIKQAGADLLINRKSATWRGLTEAQKAKADNSETAVKLLAANPTLIKRPAIEANKTVYVGWTDSVKSSLGV